MTHTTRAHGRRILSMLMAFVLALSLLPTAAFAAGGGGPSRKWNKGSPLCYHNS